MVTTTDDAALWRGWFDAAARAEVDAALRALYADLDAAVTARGPTCWLSGKCCNFDAYGHRLYVTALEVAWVLLQVGPRADAQPQASGDGCVFQVGKMCGVHAVRPLGCRVFFCEQGTQQWQQDLYESMLARLRTLHDGHGVEYRYLEWRAGLTAARAARAGG